MGFKADIASERVKLIKCVQSSKLGKMITSGILNPILDQLESDADDILIDVAEYARDRILSYMASSVPTGRTYKIVEYDANKPKGQRSTVIGEYTASAPGEPPAQLTDTLIESIGYELFSDGSFIVGLIPDYGEMSAAASELESSGYAWGSILIGPNASQTPVGTYGRALESGYSSALAGPIKARPWFEIVMDSIREDLRERIRKNMRTSLNQATRRYTVRRAIYFRITFS